VRDSSSRLLGMTRKLVLSHRLPWGRGCPSADGRRRLHQSVRRRTGRVRGAQPGSSYEVLTRTLTPWAKSPRPSRGFRAAIALRRSFTEPASQHKLAHVSLGQDTGNWLTPNRIANRAFMNNATSKNVFGPTPYSLFPIPCSLFPVPYSLSPIHCSLARVPSSRQFPTSRLTVKVAGCLGWSFRYESCFLASRRFVALHYAVRYYRGCGRMG
jgi:hypothetical protein